MFVPAMPPTLLSPLSRGCPGRPPRCPLFPYTTLFRSILVEPLNGARPCLLGRDLVVAFRPNRRSEEHTSELQSLRHLVCRLLLEKKKRRREEARETAAARRRSGSARLLAGRAGLSGPA